MPRPRERRGRGGRGASQRPVEDYPDEDDDEDKKPPFVDLYAALELDKSASSASIKKSYRTLALRWHPDKNAGYADAQVKFQAIGKAYEILGDPRKKSYYDTTGDVEDIDVTADEFVNTFVEMMDEMLGDSSIGEMLEGLDSRSMSNMPPFPFPEVLFPENTFPAGMKFAKDFHVPPAVSELLENEGPEALQDLVRKARLENKKGPGRKSSSQFDDDDDDYSDSGSDEWESASDFDEEEAAGNTRDAVPRGGRAGPNASSPRGTGSKLENISLDDENDSEMDEDELLEMMRSMPPEMFQQFLREDAANGGGGATAEEAVKLLELLHKGGEGGMGETFGQILGGSDVPPEIERLLSGFGGRKNNSKNDSADFGQGQRDDADPVSSGGNSGGRGGKIHFDQRARPRNGGKSAFRRGKKGGPGPDFVHKKENGSGDGGFGPTENGDLRFDKNSKHDESSAARADPTQTTPPSETPGPNRDKNRRKKLRRKQQAEGGVGSFDNSSMGKQSPIRSQEVLWCPAAPRAATSSELADSALSNFDRETKKAWIDAAKGGDLFILKALFSKHPGLTLLRSPGIGHTALHWSCSRGESLLHVTKWLLSPSVNLDPNALNHEGATSLHAAAGVGHVELLHVLASYGVDPCVRCDAGERAGDVAARREHVAFAAACREGEKRSESSSLNGTAASERDEKKSVPVVAAPTRSTPKHDPRDDSDSSDDETSKRAKLAFVSAEAKKKGNAAFAVGDYGKAAKQFTMAIRVDKANNTPNHVLFSNRSGALAGCGRYEDALADAERCIRMAPTWSKGYGRKGAALVGLGQGGEATKAYLAGLAVDPGSEALRAGLAEAKAAIRVAQGRYTEMWGKESSGGVMADEGESAESAPATQTSNGVSATAKKVFSNAPPGNRRDQSDQNDKTLADKYTATDENPADSTGPDKNGDDKKQIAPETLQATLAVNALDKEVCKKWLAAAKRGDLATLQKLHALDKNVLYAWGKGTSFGFTGNSAMHWSASQGHVACVRWLLRVGFDPDTRNNNDSAPAHSAAGSGKTDVLRCLFVEGGATPSSLDGCGETCRDVAVAMGNRGGVRGGDYVAGVIDLCARVGKLRLGSDGGNTPGDQTEKNGSYQMDLKTCREVLQLAGVDTTGFAERGEFVDATRAYLRSLPPGIEPPPGGKWLVAPSLSFAMAVATAAAATAPASETPAPGTETISHNFPESAAEDADVVSKSTPSTVPSEKDDPSDSDSSDDETSKRAKLAFVSAEAKKKGNAAFAVGDYGKAAKQFTMAIRVDKANNTPNHVLFSNRSGALAGCGRYEDALADAERCIRMAPTWGKGFGRKGAALTGLGQGGEAVKAYLAGLVVDPGSAALRAGLAEAKAAIRVAQGRYTEMWGKQAS